MCEHASLSLSAYDVTGHEQKDLVRISQGLDIYFNVFCRVKCVICRLNEVGQAASCIPNDLRCAKKLKKQMHIVRWRKANGGPF